MLSSFNLRRFMIPLLIVSTVTVMETVFFNIPFWLSIFSGTPSGTTPPQLNISIFRLSVCAICTTLAFVFRPGSPLWKTELKDATKKVKAMFCILLVGLLVSIALFSQISGQAKWLEQGATYNTGIEAVQDGNQYNHLANALINGSVSLDIPVSEILLNMDNPYDPSERAELNKEKHDAIYWDYAYYDGNYYCYFGIIPCLITFLPFKLLTGMDLRTDVATVAFGYLLIISSLYFLKKVQEAWFPRLNAGSFFAGVFCFILSCGILEQVFLPRIYPIPMLSALGFTLLGLGLWLSARTDYRNYKTWKPQKLVLGSFCVALTLGCRPQLILACLLAFPLFHNEIRERQFFTKESAGRTLAMILPFIIVALPIAWYNYIRFDSITDFGAAYNLTGGDMTSYKFAPRKIAVQVLEYLFLPFQFISAFPFISTVNDSLLVATHPSLYTTEPFYAGFVFLTPIVLMLTLLLFKRFRKCLSKDTRNLIFSCLPLSLLIIVIASYVSGTNMRYFIDFGWLLLTPTVLTYWALSSKFSTKSILIASFPYIGMLGIGMYCWTFLGTARFGALVLECPTIWNAIASIFGA